MALTSPLLTWNLKMLKNLADFCDNFKLSLEPKYLYIPLLAYYTLHAIFEKFTKKF